MEDHGLGALTEEGASPVASLWQWMAEFWAILADGVESNKHWEARSGGRVCSGHP